MFRISCRYVILILIGVFIIGFAQIVSAQKREIVVWTIWKPQFDETVVNPFNAQSKDVTVRHEYIPGHDAMVQKLTAAITGGNPPDIAITDCIFTRRFAVTGQVICAEDLIKSQGGIKKEDIFPVLREFSTINGKFYALPFTSNDIILYYNVRLFKEVGLDPNKPPKTWDDLVAYGEKLTNPSKNQFGLGIPFFDSYFEIPSWDWQVFNYQNGGKFLSEDYTKAYLNTSEAIEALQFWVDLVHKYKITPPQEPQEAFARGLVAMRIDGSWMLSPEGWGYPATMKDPFRTAILPYKKKPATNIGGEHFLLFKSTPEREKAAWEFLKYALSPEVDARFCIPGGYLPTTRSAQASNTWKEYLRKDPRVKVAMDSLRYGYARPAVPQYYEISKTIAEAIQEAITLKATPKEALDEANAKIEALLKR